MTTPAAERFYLAQHELEMEGKGFAVYNPHSKPVLELPIIYGFNNGGEHGWMHACLIAADGTCLGGHICTSEGYMPHDLGILEGTRPDRHETFRQHYPDGYRMEFIPSANLLERDDFNAAIALNKAQAEAAKEQTL